MTKSNKQSKNQKHQTELPFDTPLNPQQSFLIENQEVNYRQITLKDEETLSDNKYTD